MDIQLPVRDVQVQTATTATKEAGGFKELLETHSAKLPKEGDLVTGTVLSVAKNEVLVDLQGVATGVARGFELVDESGEYSSLRSGDEVSATVIDLENEKGLIELSFRSAGHKKAWDKLRVLMDAGTITQVKIIEANKGGLLVACGNVSGFMPVSQLSPEHYPRIQGGDKNKILDRLKSYIGELFDAKIIDVGEEEDKLIVSEKAAWEEQQKDLLGSYNVGDVIEGTVSVITEFGAFVQFGQGLEGLIHISELAWQRIDDPRDIVHSGQKIKAQIIKIERSKIFLSMKRLIEDPWMRVKDRYAIGQKVMGKVLKVNPFGLFVELDPQIHGLAHSSELSAKGPVDPMSIAKPGDNIEFTIISIDPQEHRLGLSLKPVQEKVAKKEASEIEQADPQPSEAAQEDATSAPAE
ncbi:MAG: S1 RNA-binding domain-containing protein [Patescibacteria group bacterium]